MIAAILRAQLLSMRNGRPPRPRAFSLILRALIMVRRVDRTGYGAVSTWSRTPAPGRDRCGTVLRRWALLGVCFYWQAMPILSASMGSALDMRKLMLYPVPHGKLFQVEVLLRLTTGARDAAAA